MEKRAELTDQGRFQEKKKKKGLVFFFFALNPEKNPEKKKKIPQKKRRETLTYFQGEQERLETITAPDTKPSTSFITAAKWKRGERRVENPPANNRSKKLLIRHVTL